MDRFLEVWVNHSQTYPPSYKLSTDQKFGTTLIFFFKLKNWIKFCVLKEKKVSVYMKLCNNQNEYKIINT